MIQAHTSTPRNVRRSGWRSFAPLALHDMHDGAARRRGDSVGGMTVMRSVGRAIGASSLLVGVWCSPVRADDAQLPANALSGAKDANRIVDVVESLGVAVVRGPSSSTSSGAYALVSTRESPMPLLLEVDCGRSSITLLRAADGHLLSRKVARDTFADAPYAAAVIATEMVELMREEPLKRGVSGRPDAGDLHAHAASNVDTTPDHGNSESPSRLPVRSKWASTFRRRIHSTTAVLNHSVV